MDRHFDKDLLELKEQLLEMGRCAEEMVEKAIQSFHDRDEGLARDVFEIEKNVNAFHLSVDGRCEKLLALHQPMAVDLRFIMASLKVSSELERVGDQAVNICQTCCYHYFKEAPVTQVTIVTRMAEISRRMLKDCLDSFSRKDVELAKTVLMRDEEEDALKRQALAEFIDLIKEDPNHAKQFVDLILLAKNYERIGDHATNVAEDVIFMVLGKDIRHHHEEKPAGNVA